MDKMEGRGLLFVNEFPWHGGDKLRSQAQNPIDFQFFCFSAEIRFQFRICDKKNIQRQARDVRRLYDNGPKVSVCYWQKGLLSYEVSLLND